MGIPGLINAIGAGERVSLSKLAISHLQRTARPIRVAVDISIWLFQVQSGRGGKNPELRTLFFRLLKLLALPIHPLFVYDGRNKPPFKRGKSVSYGSTPLIRRSKDLIERFRFPWHEAPGEAEAECARLQQVGLVDAVMSNDVDALMFGSKMTVMNFSKESGTGTTAATHVTCYRMDDQAQGHASFVPLDRPGMILFAMLSGGDYAEGVKGCGSKLAAEIAQAGFGEDLLDTLASRSSDLDPGLNEWRERLQYELDENESGYFKRKHKAVRIPADFPDKTILTYYAEPKVSTTEEIAALKTQLRHSWDQEIDPLAIRTFAAENFEWNYRSGARKVIKLLAEPLISYRLRLQRPVIGVTHGTLALECDTPWLQKVYRTRANFGTDGTPELQVDMLPIDVVGLDLLAEEPNPPLPSQEMPTQSTVQSGADDAAGEEEEPEDAADEPPPSPSKTRVTKRYDPFTIEKIWIFETIAKLGIPEVVTNWDKEQAAKANKKAPKNPPKRRTGPKKKGPIDPGMKHGSILKYGTLTKEASELSTANKSYLINAASPKSQGQNTSTTHGSAAPTEIIDLDSFSLSPSMYPEKPDLFHQPFAASEVDNLISSFSTLSTAQVPSIKRHPMSTRLRPQSSNRVLSTGDFDFEEDFGHDESVVSTQIMSSGIRLNYDISDGSPARSLKVAPTREFKMPSSSPKPMKTTRSKRSPKKSSAKEDALEIGQLQDAIKSLSISFEPDDDLCSPTARSKPGRVTSTEQNSVNDRPSRVNNAAPVPRNSCRTDVPEPAGLDKPEIKSGSPSKLKKDPKPKTTIGHAENVLTFDGFWETQEETNPEPSRAFESTSGEGSQKNGKEKKKRLPRVSILDMV